MLEEIRTARKFGISVIALTLVFRLFELGVPLQGLQLLQSLPNSPNTDTQAGQEARLFSFPFPIESSPPADYSPPPWFTEAQAEIIALTNTSSKSPDLAALLTAPLEWSLAGDEPTVLIVHTHTSESYELNGENYQQTAAYRTLEEEYNMLSIGDEVARLLEQSGIRVIHDRTFHDYPSYNAAYANARKSIQNILAENPQIQLVLDLHRDANEDSGRQLSTSAQVDGRESAQLMTVLGVGRSGLENDKWETNLSFALKLQCVLESDHPGLCRPVSLRPQRYNQDLAPVSALIEVGSAGDTREKALLAAQTLAEAIIQLKDGSV